MGRRNSNIVFNSFYCMKCGNKSYNFTRKKDGQKAKIHRKKMYCPHCRIEVNHVECRNEEDVFQFKQDFEDGVFKEELEKSLEYLKGELI